MEFGTIIDIGLAIVAIFDAILSFRAVKSNRWSEGNYWMLWAILMIILVLN